MSERSNRMQDSVIGGMPSRARLWQVLREEQYRPLEIGLLTDMARVNVQTARGYLECLINAGFVARAKIAGSGSVKRTTYQLINDVGVDYPRVRRDGTPLVLGQVNNNMWRTMRMLKVFTAAELAAHASTSAVEVKLVAAQNYVGWLHRAGYLTVLSRAKSNGVGRGRTFAKYQLSRDTGPKSPIWQKIDCVYDQNLNQVVWHEEVGNE